MATGQIALSRQRTPAHVQKSRPAVPAFLQKLHEMVNDPNNHELIRWSDAGDSFFVLDHERFAREVLGRWFKHQNFASFVRQLNMYGFHKIPHLQQGVLRSDTDTEFWNFEHPNFHRGQPDLLCLIQRKKQAAQPGDEPMIDIRESTQAATSPSNPAMGQVMDVQTIMTGITAIQRHQSSITAELNELKRSNQLLWQDAMDTRTKHQKQQDTINRIVKFLAGVFGNHATAHKEDVSVDSIQSRAVVPRRPTRFLIEDGRRRKIESGDERDTSDDNLISDPYPTVETPKPVPSPDTSDIVTPSSTYLGAYHPPAEIPTPEPSEMLLSSTSTPSIAGSVNESSTTSVDSPTSDVNERSMTPGRSPSSIHPEFDPRIQLVLNQLTPGQISQLLSSISHSLDPLPSSDNHEPPPLSSQITQYTPPLSDFFTHFSLPLSQNPQSSSPMESLLSFDEDDNNNLGRSWHDVDGIQSEVDGLNADIATIATFAKSLGLDYDTDKDTTTSSDFVPSSSTPIPPVTTNISPTPSLHIYTNDTLTDPSVLGNGTEPPSQPSPTDSLFDIESLFGFRNPGGGGSDRHSANLGYPTASEAFADLGLGNVHLDTQQPLPHPQQLLPEPVLTHEPPVVGPLTGQISPGSKRKPDEVDLVPQSSVAAVATDSVVAPITSSTTFRSSKRRKR